MRRRGTLLPRGRDGLAYEESEELYQLLPQPSLLCVAIRVFENHGDEYCTEIDRREGDVSHVLHASRKMDCVCL